MYDEKIHGSVKREEIQNIKTRHMCLLIGTPQHDQFTSKSKCSSIFGTPEDDTLKKLKCNTVFEIR